MATSKPGPGITTAVSVELGGRPPTRLRGDHPSQRTMWCRHSCWSLHRKRIARRGRTASRTRHRQTGRRHCSWRRGNEIPPEQDDVDRGIADALPRQRAAGDVKSEQAVADAAGLGESLPRTPRGHARCSRPHRDWRSSHFHYSHRNTRRRIERVSRGAGSDATRTRTPICSVMTGRRNAPSPSAGAA